MVFVGPVFTREAVTAPRRARMYVARSAYVASLLVLMATAWQVLAGTQEVRNVGDLARFGATVFQILAPLQLAVMMFFAALSAASAVAAEKDRQTLILLLLTHLSNFELVVGKLLASLLNTLVLLAAALPLFMLIALLGGVSHLEIARVFAVTLSSALVAGSLGSTLAFWREKTFQALAMTAIGLVVWIAVGEVVARGAFGDEWRGVACDRWAVAISPWRATLEAAQPFAADGAAFGLLGGAVNLFLVVSAAAIVLLNTVATLMVRVWNPSREARRDTMPQDAAATPSARQKGRTRQVWDNPILWREMRTWAYGRKILVVRLAYWLLAAAAAAALVTLVGQAAMPREANVAAVLVPFAVLSLVLINAQAVTALTSERDARALDLLLVTDLTPKEFVFGKLGGVFYNTKEMVLFPAALCVYLRWAGVVSFENLGYLTCGWLVLCGFANMLGVHTGMNYANSRGAVAVSLGTVFFLFVGVAVCMRIMVAFSGSFQVQLTPFLTAIFGGGIGLYVALGVRNPSSALKLASAGCPFAIFYAITSHLLGYTLGVFLVLACTFGFTTLAMLVPALFEFDVATGRTTGGEE
ncbi:MAG TPA: hypothetical protein VMV69_00855 [Pirellulales bacterium]|nr:hypothetical protein [Pirellulales bacterium]